MKKQGFLMLFAIVVAFALVAAPFVYVQAQEATTTAASSGGPCSGDVDLGDCVINIYQWALGIAVLLALVMIIVAGYRYMTAGGNAQTVASAKEMLSGALVGLVLLFSAVLILRTINPDLVDFSNLRNIGDQQPVPSQNNVTEVPDFAFGPSVSGELVASSGLPNATTDEQGNIVAGLSAEQSVRLTNVQNSEKCKQIIEALRARGSTLNHGCNEYNISNPDALSPAIQSAVGGPTDNLVVVTGSIFYFDGNWIAQGGGVNVSIAVDLILGVHNDAGTSGQIPSTSTPQGTGSSVACTLEVFCEDPVTGDRYEPGPSGCQGAGYTGPAGTRQVSECLYAGTDAPSCSADIRFALRNCIAELDSIRIDGTNNFNYFQLPSSRGASGTLFAVPGVNEGSVNINCSYGAESYEAAACGAAMSGGFCEPWFSPPGCIPR